MQKRSHVWAAIAVTLTAIAASYLWATRHGSTPPFRDAQGVLVAGSVAETEGVTLNGAAQWITVRGRNRSSPILIWLSGGPGLDETFLLRKFNAPLEDRHLVVYWTQRGAGRSYSKSVPIESMHLSQFVDDLDALIAHLTHRFGAQKVILVGHSWGTAIGVAYARKHPEKVAAYVGIGQISDMAASERDGYQFALSQAQARGDKKAIVALRAIGPPPYPLASMLVQRRYVAAYGGAFWKPVPLTTLILWSLETDEGTWLDLALYLPGQDYSLKTLWPEIAALNLTRDAPALDVPVAIFAGRHDLQVSATEARRYFESLDAPRKVFRWFEQSAHSPNFEESETFNRALEETLATLTTPAQ